MGDGSFLLQDLHFNGCDGLVALPGGFEASTLPLCWPSRSYCSLGSFIPVASGLQSVAVELFFSFLVTYSARLIFHFCVADLIATQNVPTQPVPLSGRRKYFQNVRAFIF